MNRWKAVAGLAAIASILIQPAGATQTSQNGPPQEISGISEAMVAYNASASDLRAFARKEATRTGIDPEKFIAMLECESAFRSDALGDSGHAYSVAQFWEGTFSEYKTRYGAKLEYRNPYDQITLAATMIRDGYASHWLTCAGRAGILKKVERKYNRTIAS